MEEKKHVELGLDMSPFAVGKPFNKPFMDELEKRVIEKIAWQVFLNKTGLRFKRELTADEMKQITEVESYEYYREQAMKIYKKKQKAVLNKKYPLIKVPSSGKRTWMGGARCLCFVYSKYNSNFVLEGYYEEVKNYLKQNYTHYFCNYSLWSNGQNRDIWDFWKEDIMFSRATIREKKKGEKSEVRPYSNSEMSDEEISALTFKFKRLPKRWIPEFDKL
jgi:hypothetical protein